MTCRIWECVLATEVFSPVNSNPTVPPVVVTTADVTSLVGGLSTAANVGDLATVSFPPVLAVGVADVVSSPEASDDVPLAKVLVDAGTARAAISASVEEVSSHGGEVVCPPVKKIRCA